MTLESEFLGLMPDTCTISAPATLDGYGKRTWASAAVSYRCRVEPADKLVRSPTDREVHVTGTLYIYGSPTVTPDHRIVLPDGSIAKIAEVQRHRDETGAHHVTVLLGT